MARWRKQPSETGLARVCQGPRGFDLVEAGKVVMCVRPRAAFGRRTIAGWYFVTNSNDGWVGPSHNSLWQADGGEFATPDEAKATALAYYKANKTANCPTCGRRDSLTCSDAYHMAR